MASYQKRGKTWQYTISRMVNGKPDPIRKGGFSTKAEAKAEAEEIEVGLRKGINLHLKPVPFADYYEDWLKTYKSHVKKSTFERYQNTLDSIKTYWKNEPIQEITKRSYQQYLNDYGQTHAKSTVQKLNTQIRSCVTEAVDEGIIRTDFTRGAVFSGTNVSKSSEEKHLSYFDSKRLLNYLYSNRKTMPHYLIVLGLTTGMRFSELVGLTRKDFNFSKKEISISKTWGYKKTMEEGFGDTKTYASKRVIKVDDKTMDLFKELFNNKPSNIHDLVFFAPNSKYKVYGNSTVNKSLSVLQKTLNIVDPITVHGLRHTHASILLYKNVSIYYVSERLGHKNIDITLKTYAHIIKELRQKDEKNTIKLFNSIVV